MATSMDRSKQVSFWKEQLSAAFGNSSVVVKFISITIILGYLLTFIHGSLPYIVITPGYVFPPNGQVNLLLTYAFVELHFWDVIIDIAVVILCGKLLEPLWGAMDMLLFFAIVNICVGVLTSFIFLFKYLLDEDSGSLFMTHIFGLAGFIAAFSVAVKQVMPDHILFATPMGKLRNTHIPLLLLLTAIFFRLLGLLSPPYPFQFGWGIVVSWVYLRFYQKHSNGNRGDMADNFSFASFFPSQLQPLIEVISYTVFIGLVKIKICKKPQRRYDVGSPTTITVSLPGTDPQDAERRRQVALKALNERLSKSEQPTKWPSLVDEGGSKSADSSPERELSSVEVHKPRPIPVPEFKDQKPAEDPST